MSLPGVGIIDSGYLQTTDSLGNTTETKFWGTLNTNVQSYQSIDDATRALCSLSKNTYDDTLLKSTVGYGNGVDNDFVVGTAKQVSCRIKNTGTQRIVLEKTIWSGSINPEVTAQQMKETFGHIPDSNGYYTENNLGPTTLFSLVDTRQVVPQGNCQINARSQNTISVNEQLSI